MLQLKIPQIFTQSKSAYFPFVKIRDFGNEFITNNSPKNTPQITAK